MNKQRYTRDTRRISKNAKLINEIDFSRTYRTYNNTYTTSCYYSIIIQHDAC